MSDHGQNRTLAILPLWAAVVLIAPTAARAQSCLDAGMTFATADNAVDDAPFSVVSCDLNGDGYEDLATANDASDTVSVLLNDGTGHFDLLRRWPVGLSGVRYEPVDIACCDLNGDQQLDLITVNHTSDNISILYNSGNVAHIPQFSGATHHTVGEAPWAVRCAPIDGDVQVDIVTANFTADSVSVLINDGGGHVDAAASYVVGVDDGPHALTVCDIDGDTDLDVATGNFSGGSVTVLRNDGDAGLIDTGDVALGANPFGIACCGLDQTAGPDIVAANLLDDSIIVLFNDGDGSFGSATRAGGADGAASVACGDIDRDGTQEIVTANLSADDVSIFYDTGKTFQLLDAIPIGSNPSSIIVAALTSSSRADLAVAFAGGVRVLGNDCVAPSDLDGDLDTDLADFSLLQQCFGVVLPDFACRYTDLDHSGVVDLGDHQIMAERFAGPTAAP